MQNHIFICVIGVSRKEAERAGVFSPVLGIKAKPLAISAITGYNISIRNKGNTAQ
jgi:hypothetical protein